MRGCVCKRLNFSRVWELKFCPRCMLSFPCFGGLPDLQSSISLWCSALVWCYTMSECETGFMGAGSIITCCLNAFLCLRLTKEHKEAIGVTCDFSGTGSRRCAENSQLSLWLVFCTQSICICFATKKWRLGRHLYFWRLLSQRQVMTSQHIFRKKNNKWRTVKEWSYFTTSHYLFFLSNPGNIRV